MKKTLCISRRNWLIGDWNRKYFIPSLQIHNNLLYFHVAFGIIIVAINLSLWGSAVGLMMWLLFKRLRPPHFDRKLMSGAVIHCSTSNWPAAVPQNYFILCLTISWNNSDDNKSVSLNSQSYKTGLPGPSQNTIFPQCWHFPDRKGHYERLVQTSIWWEGKRQTQNLDLHNEVSGCATRNINGKFLYKDLVSSYKRVVLDKQNSPFWKWLKISQSEYNLHKWTCLFKSNVGSIIVFLVPVSRDVDYGVSLFFHRQHLPSSGSSSLSLHTYPPIA